MASIVACPLAFKTFKRKLLCRIFYSKIKHVGVHGLELRVLFCLFQSRAMRAGIGWRTWLNQSFGSGLDGWYSAGHGHIEIASTFKSANTMENRFRLQLTNAGACWIYLFLCVHIYIYIYVCVCRLCLFSGILVRVCLAVCMRIPAHLPVNVFLVEVRPN